MPDQESPVGPDSLAGRFEAQRPRLHRLAYRLLGRRSDADDAVQDAWLRLARTDPESIDHLDAWLTTVTSRACFDLLRARSSRREDRTDPLTDELADDVAGPEAAAIREVEVGLALSVMLERLGPAERVAFVLHDLFAVPFNQIAAVLDRSPDAAKKLASRARHRVRGGPEPAVPSPALTQHAQVVHAFLAATRDGDLDTLLTLLAPDVVRRGDTALPAHYPVRLRGALDVGEETRGNARQARHAAVLLIDGAPGLVVATSGRVHLALRLSIRDGTIETIDLVAEPGRLRDLVLALPAWLS